MMFFKGENIMIINRLTSYFIAALLAVTFSFAILNNAQAAKPAAAVEMAEKAHEYYKANGNEASLKVFTESLDFKDGELYVYVLDKKGTMMAHGAKATLIGKDFLKFSDTTGKRFGHDIIKIKDTGWVDYYWLNPVVNKVQLKKTYVINTGENFICVGVYVNE